MRKRGFAIHRFCNVPSLRKYTLWLKPIVFTTSIILLLFDKYLSLLCTILTHNTVFKNPITKFFRYLALAQI